MSSQQITYYLYDFLSSAFLGSLPFRGVTFSSQLNAPGQFSGTLDLTDPRIQALDPLNLTTPNKRVLVVDYQGQIIWAGLLTTRDWQVQGSPSGTKYQFQVQATELWTYFSHRLQATDYSSPPYSGIDPNPSTMPIWDAAHGADSQSNSVWDPLLMAAQVVYDALGNAGDPQGTYGQSAPIPNGNPVGGMKIGFNGHAASTTSLSAVNAAVAAYLASGTNTPSAEYVNATFPWTSQMTIEAITSQLAQLGNSVGFDYAVDIAYLGQPGTALVATVNFSYPRRGRTVAQDQLIIDLSQARQYRFPEDGTQMAWQVSELGGGQALIIAQNVYVGNAGYALFERQISRAQILSGNVQSILDTVSYTDLYLYSYPPVAPTVTLPLFGGNLALGSFTTGDDVQLYLPTLAGDLSAFDPRFPAGLNQEWRIVGWSATVPDQGDATLQLTLNTPPVVSPQFPAI